MPMISPYTKYASMINKATPYNYPGEQGPVLGGGPDICVGESLMH